MARTRGATPKFFDSALTGSGGRAGILGAAANPSSLKSASWEASPDAARERYANGGVSVLEVPTLPAPRALLELAGAVSLAGEGAPVTVARGEGGCEARLSMHVSVMAFDRARGEGGKARVRLRPTWRMCAALVPKGHDAATAALAGVGDELAGPALARAAWECSQGRVAAALAYTTAPYRAARELCRALAELGWDADEAAAMAWLDDWSSYADVCACAALWQGGLARELEAPLASVKEWGEREHAVLAAALSRLESCDVPVDSYQGLYRAMRSCVPDDVLAGVAHANVQTLLARNLDLLDRARDKLASLPSLDYDPGPRYTPEQAAAIRAEEGLVVVQSGAGCGKSTVIRERIACLTASGVEPSDLLVLSFTNKAADHIRQISPGAQSMTIASMVHSLYQQAHPGHELSDAGTLANSVASRFPAPEPADFADVESYLAAVASHELGERLRRAVMATSVSAPGSHRRLNELVRDERDAIAQVLDACGQTCLELEIVMCYQEMDGLDGSEFARARHVIMDEVQDTSVFEFVFLLGWVARHRQTLYIVGDASQTLYEFRASDPRALNALEASGVFAPYRLQTNFRSCQEVLDYANTLLARIEANDFANIRLSSPTGGAGVCAQSFASRVRMAYVRADGEGGWEQSGEAATRELLVPYVAECVARGEQVALLAYTNREVARLSEAVMRALPEARFAAVAPPRAYASTFLSGYAARKWRETRHLQPYGLAEQISGRVAMAADELCRTKGERKVIAARAGEWAADAAARVGAWERQFAAGQMGEAELFELVRRDLISYEVRSNAVSSLIVYDEAQQRLMEAGQRQADVLTSTIHSAKGLEFDNVALVMEARSDMSQEDLRMYYVALTRAMHTELVLAHGREACPAQLADWQATLAALPGA